MGVTSSKIEDDKALQLCRERKKFVRQALDGRCSLAAAHVTYVQSLKNTGTALRKFFEPEAPVESSLYTSTNATPEPLALTEKSLSHFSISSRSLSHPVDATENLSPSPSPPSSRKEMKSGLENVDDFRRLREEEGIPELEDEEEKHSFHASEESEDSEENDDPPVDTLVRSFENLNRVQDHVVSSASSAMPSTGSVTSETELVNGEKNGSVASTFLKACFSCGEDPSQVQEEPAQNSVNYLTWHRTTSSRSSSSRNFLGSNAKDDNEDLTGNIFENFCMISGSHASTLDRLYAWERKLYDEVKASWMVRREYDVKRTILRQLESKGEHSSKIDKTRAVVKDLHSRIRVAIHRIDSISKRIEELRDKELQPQLEELIDGLSRMWVKKPTKKKRKQQSPSLTLRRSGPPIYVTCGTWLDKLEALPAKQVVDATKGLAGETAHLLPRQEKNQGKSTNPGSWKADNGSDSGINMLRDEASEDCISGFEHFRSSLEDFLAS
ncbi:hypothetical protein GH714_008080 [Hevea brasiliensis]|uniref:DUF632 domain-containing protein n=1 Tax=Hevea brasiliensis TaxID=3981 RepID=A0A6A6LII6_HEVBR|nr:hypothetical protein GH714_008080 [Hevea brasiliensis]